MGNSALVPLSFWGGPAVAPACEQETSRSAPRRYSGGIV